MQVLGSSELIAGDLIGAEHIAGDRLQERPDDPAALLLLLKVQTLRSDFERAMRTSQLLMSVQPDDGKVLSAIVELGLLADEQHSTLGQLALKLSRADVLDKAAFALCFKTLKRVATSIDAETVAASLQQLEARATPTPRRHLEYAQVAVRAELFPTALRHVEAAIASDPGSRTAYRLRAQCARVMEDSALLADTALRLTSLDPPSALAQALLLARRGAATEAAAVWTALSTSERAEEMEAWQGKLLAQLRKLAKSARRRRDLDKEVASLRSVRAVASDAEPESARLQAIRADLLAFARKAPPDDLAEKRQRLDRVLGLFPGDSEAARAAALLEERRGNWAPAGDLWRQAAADPSFPLARSRAARAAYRSGDFVAAMRDINQVDVTDEPNFEILRRKVVNRLSQAVRDSIASGTPEAVCSEASVLSRSADDAARVRHLARHSVVSY